MKKRWSALAAVFAVLFTLAACESGAGGKNNDDEAKTKLGMAVYGTNTASAEEASVDAVVAAVLTDKEGVILACKLDELQIKPTIAAGSFKDSGDYKTKGELGDAYGMKAGGAKQEWYQQAEAFCKYVIGKTANQVAGIETADGKATDADLSAGCTVAVTGFMKAVSMAAENAVEGDVAAADKLGIAVTAHRTGDENAPQYDAVFSAVAVGAGGKLTGCVVDELQKTLTVENGAFKAESGDIKSKKQQGDAYNMKAASGIGLEWYEQVENLQKYLSGKTTADIDGVTLKDGKAADLASGCTIAVSGMLQNVQKAMKNAA